MNRKYIYFILPFIFLSLLLILIYFVGNKPELQASQDVQTENPPFPTYITGTGIVEPASGNVMMAPPFNRVIETINVRVNDQVKKGEILFQLYNQDMKANLKIQREKYEESVSNYCKLEALPRKEDLIIAEQMFNKAQAVFNEYCLTHCQANRGEKCIDLYRDQQAEAEYLAAQAQFEKVKAGAWEFDLKIAQDQVKQAAAAIEAVEAEIEQTTIKSPIDGTVMQIKIHEGESSDQSKIAIVLGNVNELNLRVSIDQFNIQRFHPGARAVGFKQGDTSTEFPLKFLHIEPSMVPKKYLTNELHERVDTQVFEILYRIEKSDSHLLIGEQMDVYIYDEKKSANSNLQ